VNPAGVLDVLRRTHVSLTYFGALAEAQELDAAIAHLEAQADPPARLECGCWLKNGEVDTSECDFHKPAGPPAECGCVLRKIRIESQAASLIEIDNSACAAPALAKRVIDLEQELDERVGEMDAEIADLRKANQIMWDALDDIAGTSYDGWAKKFTGETMEKVEALQASEEASDD
jgi:hypothetical protein